MTIILVSYPYYSSNNNTSSTNNINKNNMSNIHGLSSLKNNRNNDSDDDTNNRYVGGISSRGGGSGLAVEPNTNDILGTIRSNAVEANQHHHNPTRRRTITMYRSGFTIDNGPFRRLDDPNNAEFLRDLARGITPRELYQLDTTTTNDSHNNESNDDGDDNHSNNIMDMEVGLIDKRHLEYDEDDHHDSTIDNIQPTSATATAAFTGVGQSLGGGDNDTTNISSDGIITSSISTSSSTLPTSPDESKPMTTIQIRLHNGKKIVVKCNLHDTVHTLVAHIQQATQSNNDSNSRGYVLSSGYPPKVLNDLNKTIQECGLTNAQVIQKLV